MPEYEKTAKLGGFLGKIKNGRYKTRTCDYCPNLGRLRFFASN